MAKGQPVSSLVSDLEAVSAALQGFAGTIQGMTSSIGGAVSGAVKGIASMAGAVVGPAAGLIGGVVSSVVGAMSAAVSAIVSFASVLSPAAGELFNMAMRDLSATVGQAALPALQMLTGAVQKIAAIFGSTFAALGETIGSLVSSIITAVMPAFRLLGDILDNAIVILNGLLPLFDALMEVVSLAVEMIRTSFSLVASAVGLLMAVLKPLLDIITGIVRVFVALVQITMAVVNIIMAVINAFVGALTSVIKIDAIGDFFDRMVKGIQKVTKSLYIFAAQMMKMFGMTGALSNLIKMLSTTKESKKAVAGATDIGISGIDDIIRAGTTAALAAAAGAPEKGPEELMAEIVAELKAIQKDNNIQSFQAWLLETFLPALSRAITGAAGGNEAVRYRPSDYLVWVTTGDPYERFRKSKEGG